MQKISSYAIAYEQFELNLKTLKHLNTIFPELYAPYKKSQEEQIIEKLMQTDGLIKIVSALKEGRKQSKSFTQIMEEQQVSEQAKTTITALLEKYNFEIGTEIILRETSLIFLITVFEQFLEHILRLYFESHLDSVKSEKPFTVTEILNHKDMNSLLKKIIEKEVDVIISKDIEKVNDDLGKFHLDLRNYPTEWIAFTECFYRRHVIVHNYGIPDEKYILKTKYQGSALYRLTTDSNYISNAFDIFTKIALIIREHYSTKYPISS